MRKWPCPTNYQSDLASDRRPIENWYPIVRSDRHGLSNSTRPRMPGLESSWVELLMSTWVSTWACSIYSYSSGFSEYPTQATHTHLFSQAIATHVLILTCLWVQPYSYSLILTHACFWVVLTIFTHALSMSESKTKHGFRINKKLLKAHYQTSGVIDI